VFDAKRLIGRDWSDKTVQSDIKYFPFKVIEKNSKPHIQVVNRFIYIPVVVFLTGTNVKLATRFGRREKFRAF
jgi:hypothetical protein